MTSQKHSVHLTVDLMKQAEHDLFSYVQREHFKEELYSLMNNEESGAQGKLRKSSKLRNLDPFIDGQGLLRVGGRLDRADMSFDSKHPIILPKDSPLSRLIVKHQSVGHMGKNSILTVLRQRFWILGVNTLIKRLISKCVTCRKYQGAPATQKMANLPEERLKSDDPPFSRIGMDFFGPFEVKQGRSVVKRYGVIFTCMATRAVHLEMAFSLDTNSCVNAVRRFIAMRGVPNFIRTDNGTNFVATEREMREEIQRWNQQQIQDFML